MVTTLTIKYTKYSNLNEPICYTCSKLATYTMTRVHHVTLADDEGFSDIHEHYHVDNGHNGILI